MANNNNSALDSIVELLEAQNKSLDDLLKENRKLHEKPFGETYRDRLGEMSEDTEEYGAILEKSMKKQKDALDNINKEIAENLFEHKENVIQDIKSARKKIQELFDAGTINEDQQNEALKSISLIEDRTIDYLKRVNKEQYALNQRFAEGRTIMDDWGESLNRRFGALKKGFGEINTGLKQTYTSAKNILEPWLKANDAAMAYAKTMGMSQRTADAYLKNTVSWAAENNIGILFNKTTDELIKMQSKYSEVLGRNVQLTGEQKKDMLAIEAFLGEDGMTDIANNLDNFGMGMSDTADFIKKSFDSATKYGISASKLTKTIRENIKMAQNYTFRDGLDGLSRMAKKAIELKTDMSVINGFIDKVSTVEGAITTGANLQVLGGSYAMASDPLSMLHDSLNNVEGLFDKFAGMAKGKVFYNDQTGNFEMGAMDRYLMKQAATQMGIDPSKMFDVAFRQASLQKIENQVRVNSELTQDPELIDLVKNLATWDKGRAVVNIDGKDVDVSNLKASDKDKLQAMQRTDSQNLQEMAINLRSTNEILAGIEKEISVEQAEMTHTVGQGLTNILRANTGAADTFAKIGAITNIATGIFSTVNGIWITTTGILRSMHGFGSSFGFTSPRTAGGKVLGGASGKVKSGILRNGLRNGFKSGTLAKSALKGVGWGAGIAAAGAALSIGSDIVTGEFDKDITGSFTKAAGPAICSVIGGALGGPIGAMIGGALGTVITESYMDAQKKSRAELRKKISNELSASMSHLSGLFTGENALEGNYDKDDLIKIKEALKDNKITEDDDLGYWLTRKLRKNNDLARMRDNGIDVQIPMATGGILKGNSHAEGGMPILGSDIVVEGGEYVVNKHATEEYLPLLEYINSNTTDNTAGSNIKVSPQVNDTSVIAPTPIINNVLQNVENDKGEPQIVQVAETNPRTKNTSMLLLYYPKPEIINKNNNVTPVSFVGDILPPYQTQLYSNIVNDKRDIVQLESVIKPHIDDKTSLLTVEPNVASMIEGNIHTSTATPYMKDFTALSPSSSTTLNKPFASPEVVNVLPRVESDDITIPPSVVSLNLSNKIQDNKTGSVSSGIGLPVSKTSSSETVNNKYIITPGVSDSSVIAPLTLSDNQDNESNIIIIKNEKEVSLKASKITPGGDIKISPKEPLGNQMKVNDSNYGTGTTLLKESTVSIEPVSINLSGTIKLDAGNKQFDISNDLLNNPVLISRLTEMINKQLNILDYGSYNKGRFKQKFV